MGYLMEYGCGTAVKKPARKKRRGILPIIAGITVLTSFFALHMFPEAGISLRDYLLPGDGAVTAQALQNMASDLREGESLSDAVTAFCQQILTQSGQ